MSTPDAKLSAAERAALADLEAAAVAADPGLADLLRGGARRRIRSDLRTVRAGAVKAGALVARARWWGVPATVGGLVIIVVGLAYGLVLSFAGVLLTAVGLAILANMVHACPSLKWRRRSG